MALHCQFCDNRNPEGGTKIIIDGMNYLEFCTNCGDREGMVGVGGHPEIRTLNQLFEHKPEAD